MGRLFFPIFLYCLLAVKSDNINIGAHECYRFEISGGKYIINIDLVNRNGPKFSLYYINPDLINNETCDISMAFYSETGLVNYRNTINYNSSMYLTIKNNDPYIDIVVDIYFADVENESFKVKSILIIILVLAFVGCCCSYSLHKEKAKITNLNQVVLPKQNPETY